MKYPVYPITFSYVNGIFFANNFATSDFVSYSIGAFLLALFIYLVIKPFRLYSKRSSIYFLIFCVTFFYLGSFQFQKHNSNIEFPEDAQFYSLLVQDKLKDNAYSHRYFATIYSKDEKIGKVLLYHNLNENPYEVGDVLYDKLSIQSVPKARTPFSFDYNNYLSYQSIFGQAYLSEACEKTSVHKNFMFYLNQLRKTLLDSYSPFYNDIDDQALVAGLLFGQKQDLSKDIENAYRNTGVMHVLAVSGMHVMIIFFTLKEFLQLLIRRKSIQFSIITLFLIVFAFLSGLSGSVVRAVFMCIFFLLGQLLRRDSNTRHTLVVSMLVILWYAPNFLFDVGFQLSYLAVFSIVFIYPIIKPYFTFKNKILRYIGETLGVSVAAQLGVCFLSVFYFEQFPLWFLLGNLVAIPITSFVIITLLIQMPLNFVFPLLSQIIGYMNHFLLSVCNKMLLYLNSFESIVIDQLHISATQLIVGTSVLFLIVGYIQYKKVQYVYALFVLLIGFNMFRIFNFHSTDDDGRYFIAQSTELYIVDYFKNHMKVYSTGDLSEEVLAMKKKWYVKTFDTLSIKHYAQLDQSILIIDSLIYDYSGVKADVVVLKDNPKINLERVIETTSCKQVIFHPSNKQWRRRLWKDFLDKKNIPYHDMREKGYICLK